jgi:hypothetical protein
LNKSVSFKNNKKLLEMLRDEKQPIHLMSCGLRSIFNCIPDEESPAETLEK